MQINPYLNFNGQCAEAFRTYERVLGGKIEAMFTYGDSPAAEHTPPGMQDRVMHVRRFGTPWMVNCEKAD